MMDVATSLRAVARPFGARREIGPIGTASRVVGGSIAVGVPIALVGIGWREVAAALIAFPLLATAAARLIVAGYERYAPEALARRGALCSGPACLLFGVVVAVALALDALTPVNGEIAFLVWLGASMLVAAARGYGGCEVLAFPNALTGRRDQVGCMLYTPIDTAEARRRAAPAPPAG